MYVRLGAVPERTPWDGPSLTVYVTESPSGSEPVNVIGVAALMLAVTDWGFAIGVAISTFQVNIVELTFPAVSFDLI